MGHMLVDSLLNFASEIFYLDSKCLIDWVSFVYDIEVEDAPLEKLWVLFDLDLFIIEDFL